MRAGEERKLVADPVSKVTVRPTVSVTPKRAIGLAAFAVGVDGIVTVALVTPAVTKYALWFGWSMKTVWRDVSAARPVSALSPMQLPT